MSKYGALHFENLLNSCGALIQMSLQSEQLKTVGSIIFKSITIKSIDQSIWI